MKPQHPGMTPEWFDQAINRAHTANLRMLPTRRHGVRFVTSGTSNKVYQVTRNYCQCDGHRETGRCYHRAFAIACEDVFNKSTPATQEEETA